MKNVKEVNFHVWSNENDNIFLNPKKSHWLMISLSKFRSWRLWSLSTVYFLSPVIQSDTFLKLRRSILFIMQLLCILHFLFHGWLQNDACFSTAVSDMKCGHFFYFRWWWYWLLGGKMIPLKLTGYVLLLLDKKNLILIFLIKQNNDAEWRCWVIN